jgi:hypothetical protein
VADPVLATPTLIFPFAHLRPLLRCAPHGSTFTTAVGTAAGAVVWRAPGFPHANYASGGYPADPVLATPAEPAGADPAWLEMLYRCPPGALSPANTYVATVNTAAQAVTWPAPGYPHANTGLYP